MRLPLALLAATAAFVLVAAPTGVLGMLDTDYCFTHGDRPARTAAHEESLSLFPPGPVCTFLLAGGGTEEAGPGPWPAVAAAAALAAGVAALRVGVRRPGGAGR